MRKLFAAVVVLGAALVALGPAQLSLAHSRPVRFDPSPGAVLDAAPSTITGWFTSDIRSDENSFIQVLDGSGQRVDQGDTQLSTDRREMSVALQSGLGDGAYLVHWSTHDDADGEVFSGCHYIFVGQAAADAAASNSVALDGGADCPGTVTEDNGGAAIDISVKTSGTSATVTINPTDFTARAPDGTSVDPNFGHYHIYLDKLPLDQLEGGDHHDDSAMAGMSDSSTPVADMSNSAATPMAQMEAPSADAANLVENPIMAFSNSYTFTNLQPGVHTIAVALNHDNHTPFNPPVIATQSFSIKGSTSSSGSNGVPLWTLFVTGGLAVVGLVVGAYGLTKKSA